MGNDGYRRTRFFIKKKFQLRYTLSIVFLLLTVMLVTGVGIYVGMWNSIIENFSDFRVSQNLETAQRLADYEGARYKKGDYRLQKIFRQAELLSRAQRDVLMNALYAVNRSLLPKIILLSILIFMGGIFVSHKIAGPMYRFENSAEAVQDGNLRVHFFVRRGDQMKKTATSLEHMVESLRIDFEKLKIVRDDMKRELASRGDKLPREDKEELEKIIEKMDRVLLKYRT